METTTATLDLFHPAVGTWFSGRFGAHTAPQAQAWPSIRAGRHTLIAAPTGSGKTLAAFLAAIDDLVRRSLLGDLEETVQVVYVSPLKALSNDIEKNLVEPLSGIERELKALGLPEAGIRTLVRTGDTPAAVRTAMIKRPPTSSSLRLSPSSSSSPATTAKTPESEQVKFFVRINKAFETLFGWNQQEWCTEMNNNPGFCFERLFTRETQRSFMQHMAANKFVVSRMLTCCRPKNGPNVLCVSTCRPELDNNSGMPRKMNIIFEPIPISQAADSHSWRVIEQYLAREQKASAQQHVTL